MMEDSDDDMEEADQGQEEGVNTATEPSTGEQDGALEEDVEQGAEIDSEGRQEEATVESSAV